MRDRRQALVETGLQVLRELGYSGFTQPRIASRAGVRQSLITYYFPTRAALLEAVARAAVEAQLAALDAALAVAGSDLATVIAGIVARHDNTRVLMALAQAADQEPALRSIFRDLTAGIVERVGGRAPVGASAAGRDMIHALTGGLAVIELATGRPDGEARTLAVLDKAFRGLDGR
jgi:AcrR family transcriptional regulator